MYVNVTPTDNVLQNQLVQKLSAEKCKPVAARRLVDLGMDEAAVTTLNSTEVRTLLII